MNVIAHTYNNKLCSLNICSCNKLERVNSIRYLGVIIDNQLSFQDHIRVLTGRVRKLIAVFKNIRHVADYKILRTTYFALCQSLLMYCVEAWGGAAKTHLLSLEKAQRAILKVSNFLPFRFPTIQLYRDTSLLSVRQLFLLRIIIKQHKLGPKDPHYNNSELLPTKRRQDKVFDIPKCRTFFKHRFFCFIGGYIYNKISKNVELRSLNSHTLKKTISEYLRQISYIETENLLSVPK